MMPDQETSQRLLPQNVNKAIYLNGCYVYRAICQKDTVTSLLLAG